MIMPFPTTQQYEDRFDIFVEVAELQAENAQMRAVLGLIAAGYPNPTCLSQDMLNQLNTPHGS